MQTTEQRLKGLEKHNQAPDDSAHDYGSSDVRGSDDGGDGREGRREGDGGSFDRAPRECLSIFTLEAYGTPQTQKNTEETRGIRYQP